MVKASTSNILIFIYVSMCVISLSMGMLTPLVPPYAQQLGASYFDLGIIGAVSMAPYIVLPTIVGVLSDRFGRRVFFLGGIAGCALTSGFFLFTHEVWQIIMIAFIRGIASSSLWPIAQALVVDMTSLTERIKAMGRYSLSWSLGLLVGPFFGGLFVEKCGFPPLFFMSLVVGISAFFTALALFFRYQPKSQPIAPETTGSFKNVVAVSICPIYLLTMMYSIPFGLILNIFPVYIKGLGMTAFQIGIMVSMFGIARTITFWYSESIIKIGKKLSVILALATQGFSLVAIAYVHDFALFLILISLPGFSIGILLPLILSEASKMASSAKIGMTMGVIESFTGLGFTIGPLVGGIVAESMGPTYPYLIFGGVAILSIIPICFLIREPLKTSHKSNF